jgi:hypothetical protein
VYELSGWSGSWSHGRHWNDVFYFGDPRSGRKRFSGEWINTIQIYWNNTIQIMPDYNILSIIISQMMLDDTRTIQIYPIYWGLRPPQAVKNQIWSFYSFSGLVSTVTSCKPRGVNRLRWPNHRLSASFRYAASWYAPATTLWPCA